MFCFKKQKKPHLLKIYFYLKIYISDVLNQKLCQRWLVFVMTRVLWSSILWSPLGEPVLRFTIVPTTPYHHSCAASVFITIP